MRKFILLLPAFMCLTFLGNAQNLTITSNGQTGTSGTNWSTSGTNPVILSYTGAATVNATVIEGYLNAGKSVIIQPGNTSTIDVDFQAGITKSSGGDATLTIKSNRRIFSPVLTSTSGKLNLVIIVESDGGTSGGPAINSVSTNGGHIWIGGGSGTTTWNGLTVGNGVAYSDGTLNRNTIDLTGDLSTSGGDVLFAADDRTNSDLDFGDVAAWNANRSVNTGSGDITFLTELADFASTQGYTITLTTTGVLSFASPNSTNRWPGTFYWGGTLSGTTFTGGGNLSALVINNFPGLGGLNIGTYTGTGVAGDAPYTTMNGSEVKDIVVNSNSPISIAGPVNFHGLYIYLNSGITTTGGAAGDIVLKAAGNIYQYAGQHITTNGGDVVFWTDFDGSGGGRPEILANISTSGGNVFIGGGTTGETQNSLLVPAGYAKSAEMNKQGVLMNGANINSAGGIVRIKGLSDDTGNGDHDFGVKLMNSNIQSAAGNLSVYGKVSNDLNTGAGLWIGTDNNGGAATGNVTINSTSGNIYLEGIAAPNNSFIWAHGLVIIGKSGDDISITSTTGSISFNGDGTSWKLNRGVGGFPYSYRINCLFC